MSEGTLRSLYARLAAQGITQGATYSALPIPGSGGHMAVLSQSRCPGLLLQTSAVGPRPKDIRLTGLTAAFDVSCSVVVEAGEPQQRRASILECTADPDALPLFAESARSFLQLLGPTPSMMATAQAVIRLAAIFSSLARSTSESVTGLIGELMLLLLAKDPVGAICSWRVSPADIFDFSANDARVEVKATSKQLRLHSFSWEQCHPPAGAALVASMRVVPAGGGLTVRELMNRVEDRLEGAPLAAIRLRETVAATMGAGLTHALDATFDEQICRASLQWFNLREIPAIRGDLPSGVAGLRFISDVSLTPTVSASLLAGTALESLTPFQF